jgi:hypothetical protein
MFLEKIITLLGPSDVSQRVAGPCWLQLCAVPGSWGIKISVEPMQWLRWLDACLSLLTPGFFRLWHLWWTRWNCERGFFEHFGLSVLGSFHQCFVFALYNITNRPRRWITRLNPKKKGQVWYMGVCISEEYCLHLQSWSETGWKNCNM